jgi:membrane protein involved in colicin uptake
MALSNAERQKRWRDRLKVSRSELEQIRRERDAALERCRQLEAELATAASSTLPLSG